MFVFVVLIDFKYPEDDSVLRASYPFLVASGVMHR